MKRFCAILIGALAFASPAAAKFYVPKPHHACKAHYVKRTVKVRRHHRWVKQARCVYVTPKPVSKPVSTPAPTPAGVTAPKPILTRAAIDPAYTQDPANPLKVTWAYSTGPTDGTLPLGTLSITVYQHGQVGSAGGCSMNVGGSTYGGNCTVTLPQYGAYDITVAYNGASATVAPSSSTDTETIEPPPSTVQEKWGTTPPTASPSVSALVVGSNAQVTVNDPNFEGAQNLGVTDDLGNSCTATVSGTQATCNMTVTGTPSTFTLNYPGGTSQQSSQPVAPNGQQTVTYVWGADSVPVNHPSVTVQQATVAWSGWSSGNTSGGGNCPSSPPDPYNVNAGVRTTLNACTTGSLASDPYPLGYLEFRITGPQGASYTATDGNYGANPNGSQDCSMVLNYSGQAEGPCQMVFQTLGTYTVTAYYHSQDPNYPDARGPSEIVRVS